MQLAFCNYATLKLRLNQDAKDKEPVFRHTSRGGKAKHNGVHFGQRFLYFVNTVPQMCFRQQGGILKLHARSRTVAVGGGYQQHKQRAIKQRLVPLNCGLETLGLTDHQPCDWWATAPPSEPDLSFFTGKHQENIACYSRRIVFFFNKITLFLP